MVALIASRGNIDDGVLSRMKENVVEARRLYASGEVTGYVNMDFHLLLAEATGNMIFIVVAKTLRAAFDTVAPPEKEGLRLETIRAHEQILDAIKNGDAGRARELMEAHLAQMVGVVRCDTGEGG